MPSDLTILPPDAILDPVRLSGPEYLASLDLGQMTDFTALAIGQRVLTPTGGYVDTGQKRLVQMVGHMPRPAPVFTREERVDLHIRMLHRFELRTDYVAMAGQVKAVLNSLPKGAASPILVIDHTGVGIAVFDIFRHAQLGIPIIGITITAGQQHRQDPDHPWAFTVPKKDLVSALQIMIQADRLKIAPALPLASVFTREMQSFRMKVNTNATVTYEAARDGDHDDIVLAVAMGCWSNDVLLNQQGGVL